MSGLDQRILLERTDGSLGPLLRIADDCLDARAGYGPHAHRDVDVAAVVLAGSVRHSWGEGARLAAGDVAVLRAGSGLTHDEVAGDDGARVMQCYLRSAAPTGPPSHEVHRAADGWIDLRRPDARLWVARARAGEDVVVPPGLLVVRGVDGVLVEQQGGGGVRGPGAVLVWQLDARRPEWADG